MRAKEYKLVAEAVEAGVAYGYRRAHKHVAEPEEQTIIDAVVDAVLLEICERFTFDDEGTGD